MSKRFMGPRAAISFLLCSCCAGAFAQGAYSIDSVQGTYSHRFKNGRMDGTKYTSENKLDILKVSETAAYFRVHLEWSNGHLCDLSGTAALEAAGLVYREAIDPENMCVLRFNVSDGKISFGDEGGVCRQFYCGARGGFLRVGFDLSKRREIGLGQKPQLLEAYQRSAANHPQ
jgi:hypothetical protein